jgi:hypothetical protein
MPGDYPDREFLSDEFTGGRESVEHVRLVQLQHHGLRVRRLGGLQGLEGAVLGFLFIPAKAEGIGPQPEHRFFDPVQPGEGT